MAVNLQMDLGWSSALALHYGQPFGAASAAEVLRAKAQRITAAVCRPEGLLHPPDRIDPDIAFRPLIPLTGLTLFHSTR